VTKNTKNEKEGGCDNINNEKERQQGKEKQI
jgi:hypothetical protein